MVKWMTVNSILMPDTHPAYERQLQELYEQASQELCFDRFCSTAAAVPNAMLHVAESSLVSLGGSVERLHSYDVSVETAWEAMSMFENMSPFHFPDSRL